METTNTTCIVIRWNPPRKYDTVKRLLQTLITEFDIEPVDPPPVPDASAALDASSAQPARLPGGTLALKLLEHMSFETTLTSTAGLSIFCDRLINQGTFAQVFVAEYKGDKAVAKVFGRVVDTKEPRSVKRQRLATTKERWEAARYEVVASAAFPPNQKILQLVDVCMWRSCPALIYPHFDLSLLGLLRQRPLLEVERRHVMASLLHAGAHLHAHGFVHADIKPGNVLINGPGLKYPDDWDDCSDCWNDIVRLPYLLEVILGDVGSVELGDPDQRLHSHTAGQQGVVKTTLWYRAPELLLGDSRWTCFCCLICPGHACRTCNTHASRLRDMDPPVV